MPRRRKSEQIIEEYFEWNVYLHKNGIYRADGRSEKNEPPLKRYSLHTDTMTEARKNLKKLDRHMAEKFGLVEVQSPKGESQPLPLKDGCELYLKHQSRPEILGGVAATTFKKQRSALDKLKLFCEQTGVHHWQQVTDDLLSLLAAKMESGFMNRPKGYAPKSIRNDLVTVKSAHSWLVKSKHLTGCDKLGLEIQKVEGEPHYCYTTEEVEAIVAHCRERKLLWELDRVIGLAATGLRIGAFGALTWKNIDFGNNRIVVEDESGHARKEGRQRLRTKTRKSRILPINRHLGEVLQRLDKTTKHVFPGKRGAKLRSDRFLRPFRKNVLAPLADQFPSKPGEKGFVDGVAHSFRRYFCSQCANDGVPELVVMRWLGHSDSKMVRHYYSLKDKVAAQHMSKVNFLGTNEGRSTGGSKVTNSEEPAQDQRERED